MFRRVRYLRNALRLGAFLGTLLLAGAFVGMRSARAYVHDGMQSLARQLMPYAEQGVMETPRRVVLNGETLLLAVGTTADGVPAVLDYYEQRCARMGGQITRQIQDAAQRSRTLDQAPYNTVWATMPGRRAANLETLRGGDDQSGFVACLDVGGRRLDASEIVRRARALVDTGNLAEMGNMRYAGHATHGSTGRTRIITIATDGRFNLLRMFPRTGDAPGHDLADLPRLPSMRRILSAHEEGYDYGLGVYTARGTMAPVRDFYLREMVRAGWSRMDVPRDRPLPPELTAHLDRTAAFRRGDSSMFLVFDEREGGTSMMVLAGL